MKLTFPNDEHDEGRYELIASDKVLSNKTVGISICPLDNNEPVHFKLTPDQARELSWWLWSLAGEAEFWGRENERGPDEVRDLLAKAVKRPHEP